MAGSVRLYLDSLDGPVFADPWLWKLWCWCLKEAWPSGSFTTWRALAAASLGVSESKWYRGMRRLASEQIITQKVNSKKTQVCVENWPKYCIDQVQSEQIVSASRTEESAKKPSTKKEKKAKFQKPTVEEIRAYCTERHNDIDPEYFFHHYEANGWVQGSSGKPLVNWKSAVIKWEHNEYGQASSNGRLGANPGRVHAEAGKYDDIPTIVAGEAEADPDLFSPPGDK